MHTRNAPRRRNTRTPRWCLIIDCVGFSVEGELCVRAVAQAVAVTSCLMCSTLERVGSAYQVCTVSVGFTINVARITLHLRGNRDTTYLKLMMGELDTLTMQRLEAEEDDLSNRYAHSRE